MEITLVFTKEIFFDSFFFIFRYKMHNNKINKCKLRLVSNGDNN